MTNIIITKFKNKEFAYLRDTEFLVQIGNKTGLYSTQYTSVGNLEKAILFYNKIEPVIKHNKRIIMIGNIGQTIVDIEKF